MVTHVGPDIVAYDVITLELLFPDVNSMFSKCEFQSYPPHLIPPHPNPHEGRGAEGRYVLGSQF